MDFSLYFTFSLLSFASVSFYPVSGFLRLNEDRRDVRVTTGDDVTITCEIDDDSSIDQECADRSIRCLEKELARRVRWFRDLNDELSSDADLYPNIFMTAHRIEWNNLKYIRVNLTIRPVSSTDAGNYTCCKRDLSETCQSERLTNGPQVNLAVLPPTTIVPTSTSSPTASDAIVLLTGDSEANSARRMGVDPMTVPISAAAGACGFVALIVIVVVGVSCKFMARKEQREQLIEIAPALVDVEDHDII